MKSHDLTAAQEELKRERELKAYKVERHQRGPKLLRLQHAHDRKTLANTSITIAQEELAREREVKALEAERHQQDIEAAHREAEAERARHREAYLRCNDAQGENSLQYFSKRSRPLIATEAWRQRQRHRDRAFCGNRNMRS